MRNDGNSRRLTTFVTNHRRQVASARRNGIEYVFSSGTSSVDAFSQNLDVCRKSRNRSQVLYLYNCLPICVLTDHTKLANQLVDLLAEAGSIQQARHVFDRILHKDAESWNSLIIGYANGGKWKHAVTLFQTMEKEMSYHLNDFAFLSLLKSCIQLKDATMGSQVHALVACRGLLETNIFIGSTLVDMYIKCDSMSKAEAVFFELPFRDVVLWTTLINGYVDHGMTEEALLCVDQMRQDGCSPNSYTLACSSKACGILKDIIRGQEIHAEIVMKGYDSHTIVSNSLLSMYATCGTLETAKMLFKKIPVRDVVSWTAMIDGYVEHGYAKEALKCYECMKCENIASNALTFSCNMKACCSIGAIENGRELHLEIIKRGFESDLRIGSSLVSLYVKIGTCADAQYVFDKFSIRDNVLWSALIAGYGQVGESRNAFSTFDKMLFEFSSPDLGNFGNIINACNYEGSVETGLTIFGIVQLEYGLIPNLEQYTTMVDLLGRSGNPCTALLMLEHMPYHPDYVSWCTLLRACRMVHLKAAGYAFKNAIKLNEEGMTAYVTMSNIHVEACSANL